MIGIIGKKLGMTQIFNEQGQQIPCTVVEAAPNVVAQSQIRRPDEKEYHGGHEAAEGYSLPEEPAKTGSTF